MGVLEGLFLAFKICLQIFKKSLILLGLALLGACSGLGGGGLPQGQGLTQGANPSGTFNPHGDDTPLGSDGNRLYSCSYIKEDPSRGDSSSRNSFLLKSNKVPLDDPTDFPMTFGEPFDLKLSVEKIKIVQIKNVGHVSKPSDSSSTSQGEGESLHLNTGNMAALENVPANVENNIDSKKGTYVRIIFVPEGKPWDSFLYQDGVIEDDSTDSFYNIEFSNLKIKEKGNLSAYVSINGKPDLYNPAGLKTFPSEEAYKAYARNGKDWPLDRLGSFNLHEKNGE